jgi:putative ABC transport system substrate-binding protein
LPRAERFAALNNPNHPSAASTVKDLQAAASAIGRPIEIFNTASNHEIETSFAALVEKRVDALLVVPGPLFGNRRVHLAALTAHHRLPAMYGDRLYTEAGGLMSYGSSIVDQYRQTGIYTGRVLRGEKPSDLPVMQATKFELIINLPIARLLGIEVPATLLATADEVIE